MKLYTRKISDEKKVRAVSNLLLSERIRFSCEKKMVDNPSKPDPVSGRTIPALYWEISVSINLRSKLNIALHATECGVG